MMRFMRRHKDEEARLKAEVEKAKQQLQRAEEAEPQTAAIVKDMKSHLKDNHLGDRLRLQFEQQSRRRNHGTA